MVRKKLTPQFLEKKKVPKVLIAGLVLASVLGWTGWRNLDKIKSYYQFRMLFPVYTIATTVVDGDTFVIKNGMTVRLLGIDAPGKGESLYEESTQYLNRLINGKRLTFEYDQYQDDKYGRILAYVWIDCFEEIVIYCRDNKTLVNEVMLKKGLAKKVQYEKRKKLKYDDYLQSPSFPTTFKAP